MSEDTKPDLYRRITDQIVAAIEAGAGDWRMPWHTDPNTNVVRPINVATGKPYRGVNVLSLWATAAALDYKSSEWATYRQWQERGTQVRKGERSTLVVFWQFSNATGTQEAEEGEPEESGPGQRRVLSRGYCVFNADQVSGYEAPISAPPVPTIERIEPVEQFFAAIGANIRHGGNQAFYRPSTDHIQMPPFEAFRDAVAYYAILAHEVTHWTGPKHRLDRDMSGRFGSQSYAAEELVAELGAAFLCGDLALANEPRPDHAAYVATWLDVLRSDSRAIFTAAAKAQQAADFVHGLQPAEAKAKAAPTPAPALRSVPTSPAPASPQP